jgi:hexosaminidase
MRILFIFLFVFFTRFVVAQTVNIIPKPAEIGFLPGNCIINSRTVIYLQEKKFSKEAEYLQLMLKKNFNLSLQIVQDTGRQNAIVIGMQESKLPEAYIIKSNQHHVYIHGSDNAGVFYGIQTVLQILQKKDNGFRIPNGLISDAPRFAYRGMHLDVARHFEPVGFIKKYLDYMARYKYNMFHWHLTDDQGWRIAIKKYPKLTSVGAWRNGTIIGRYPGTGNDNLRYGGFYTQEQITEIVQYAADRHITVIPEIEMPGHASAAIAAYPELSCFPNQPTKIPGKFIAEASKNNTGKLVQETWGVFEDVFCPEENTFQFLENVLDEVMQLFPGKFIHIGGDECPKEAWKKSAFCQQLIKEKGLKNEHGLQSYFIERIEKYVNSKGRNIIGWDEILEGGLAPNASVMSWRGEAGGIEAAKQKHTVMMTPGSHCYFDHSQSKNEDSVTIGGYLPVEKVYDYEPVPAILIAEEAGYVLGAQANLWTEYIKNPSKIEYMIFPRMLALSEVLWCSKVQRSWNDFEPRMLKEMKKLEKEGIRVSGAFFDIQFELVPSEKNGGLLVKLSSKSMNNPLSISWAPAEIIGERMVYKSVKYEQPFPVSKSMDLIAGYFADPLKGKTYAIHFNKATAQKITLQSPPSKNYPGNAGAFGLVNGLKSEKGIQSSEWQGFENGRDAEMIIDLGANKEISNVRIHTLDQPGSWIYLPEYIEVFASDDGVNFGYGAKSAGLEADTMGMQYMYLELTKMKTRYLKILVRNYGTIPSGKPGAGNGAWLFIDEVLVD